MDHFRNKKLHRAPQSDDEQLSENRLSSAQSDRLLMLVVESENWVKRILSQPLEKQETDGIRETQIIKAFGVGPQLTVKSKLFSEFIFISLKIKCVCWINMKKTPLSPHSCPHLYLCRCVSEHTQKCKCTRTQI